MSRIEAFSDAVFAFAATLLIVYLGTESSVSIIEIDPISFLGFTISFFVLFTFWYLYYNFFRRTKYMDNYINAVNAILLFVLLYYVFPLKSLVNSFFDISGMTLEKLAGIFELYSLGFALIFLCCSLMYHRAFKKAKQLENVLNLLFYTRHFTIFVFVGLLSIGIAFSKTGMTYGLPGIIYFILGPLCGLHSYYFFKKYKSN